MAGPEVAVLSVGAKQLAALKAGQVVIIGDVMLDHYVDGAVSRISPEAPVPILHVRDERFVAGGAANVAANVAALGGAVTLLGAVGDDGAAAQLANVLRPHEGIKTIFVTVPGRPTPTKTRYLGERQQIVRVDREDTSELSPESQAFLLTKLQAALMDAGALIISDYAKGLFERAFTARAIELGRAAGLGVIVDPKQKDLSFYSGATVITPNRKELSEASGLPCETDMETLEAAERGIAVSGADILLTRSELGMSYFAQNSAPLHMPTHAREVFDVSGAGDTVVAAFALSLASGLSVSQSMWISNVAAGITIAKQGTATVHHAELAEKLALGTPSREKYEIIEDVDEMARRSAGWKRIGLSVGFANGCFDLIHPGHIRLIHAASQTCDRLIMALNSDASVRRLKGVGRPIQDQVARAEVLGAIKGVDAVTFFDEDTPLELIRKLVPDVIIKGSDYTEAQVVGGDFIKAHGGRVHLVDIKEGQSTTRLATKVRGS